MYLSKTADKEGRTCVYLVGQKTDVQPEAGAKAAAAMGQNWGKTETDRDKPIPMIPWKISDFT